MNIHQILIQGLSPVFSAFWWLIPLLLLLAFLRSPFVKGAFGEFQVNLMANWFLDQETYKLFKNVTLPTEEDSTQIDHIIVSRFGVFVIETALLHKWWRA